jgi:DNA-binding transcriptional LysR family regulator
VTLQRGSAFRRHLDEAFEVAGLRLRPAVEVGNLSLVRRFVAAGLGYAPVPSIAFPTVPPDSGIERRGLLGVSRLTYSMARRAGVPLGRVAAGLIEELRTR